MFEYKQTQITARGVTKSVKSSLVSSCDKPKIFDRITKYKLELAIVMKKNVVAGILTDGDARRSLRYNLKAQNLKKIMNSDPVFISENSTAAKALEIMNRKKITSLLVVSDKDYKKSNKVLKGIIHIHFLLQTGIR